MTKQQNALLTGVQSGLRFSLFCQGNAAPYPTRRSSSLGNHYGKLVAARGQVNRQKWSLACQLNHCFRLLKRYK